VPTTRSKRSSFLAGAAALTFSPSSSAAAAGDLAPLAIGTLPSAADAVVNYAYDNGYFKDAGLDANISLMNNGNVIWNAVLGRSLDIGAGNIGSLAVARSRGIPLRVIAPAAMATSSTPLGFVLVRKGSPIRTGIDFNNKMVATVAIKTAGEAIFRAWVDKTGGDSKTVRYIEIPYPAMAEAVDAGRADAALIIDPFTIMAREKNTVLPTNYYTGLRLPYLVTCFVAAEPWLEANADTARKFARSIRRAALWANGHAQESHVLLSRITKIDPAIISEMSPIAFATTLEPARIEPVLDAMMKYGLLDKRVDPKEMIWT
jgi:NitT/TauT family transport system substrate-binding protein